MSKLKLSMFLLLVACVPQNRQTTQPTSNPGYNAGNTPQAGSRAPLDFHCARTVNGTADFCEPSAQLCYAQRQNMMGEFAMTQCERRPQASCFIVHLTSTGTQRYLCSASIYGCQKYHDQASSDYKYRVESQCVTMQSEGYAQTSYRNDRNDNDDDDDGNGYY